MDQTGYGAFSTSGSPRMSTGTSAWARQLSLRAKLLHDRRAAEEEFVLSTIQYFARYSAPHNHAMIRGVDGSWIGSVPP